MHTHDQNHFIKVMCSANISFPMHLLDIFPEQAKQNLNLFLPGRRNPNMLSHRVMEGLFHYNLNPISPPGTKVVIPERV